MQRGGSPPIESPVATDSPGILWRVQRAIRNPFAVFEPREEMEKAWAAAEEEGLPGPNRSGRQGGPPMQPGPNRPGASPLKRCKDPKRRNASRGDNSRSNSNNRRRERFDLTADGHEKIGLDEGDPFWNAYVEEAERLDMGRVETWNQDLESLLIFAGLYSAILTAFIIESRKGLQEDLQASTNVLLLQILQAVNGGIPPEDARSILLQTEVTWTVVFVNAMWFASLTTSLASALGAILGKEWVREYSRAVARSAVSREDGRRRQHHYDGTIRWHMSTALSIVPALLHLAFVLFFIGLIPFLWHDNFIVSAIVAGLFGVMMIFYLAATFLPLMFSDCPFGTPFTVLIQQAGREGLKLYRGAAYRLHNPFADDGEKYDAPAIAWLLTASRDPARVTTAANSVPNLRATLKQQAQFIDRGAVHSLAGHVRAVLVGEFKGLYTLSVDRLKDMSVSLRAIEHLCSRSHVGPVDQEWPFDDIDSLIPHVTSGWDTREHERVVLKVDLALAHAQLALRYYRHRRLDRRFGSTNAASFNSSEPFRSVFANLLIAPEGANIKNFDVHTMVRIIRTFASVGAAASFSSNPGSYHREKAYYIYQHVFLGYPDLTNSLLHSSLLAIRSLMSDEPPETEFLDSPSPDQILTLAITLLESIASSPTQPSSYPARFDISMALFELICRLNPPERHLFGSPEIRERLATTLRSFAHSTDDVTVLHAFKALHHLDESVYTVDRTLDVQFITRCLTLPDSRRLIMPTLLEPSARKPKFRYLHRFSGYPEVFGPLFHALVILGPLPPGRLGDSVLSRALNLLSAPSLPPIASAIDIIRGLTHICELPGTSGADIQEVVGGVPEKSTPTRDDVSILRVIANFFRRVVSSDHGLEMSLPTLLLIERTIYNKPTAGSLVFVQERGIISLGAMMNLPWPDGLKNPPPYLSLLHFVISNIIGKQDDPRPEQSQIDLLGRELNSSSILLTLQGADPIFNIIGDSRQEWLDLLERLESVLPGIVGRQELVDAITALEIDGNRAIQRRGWAGA